MTNTLAAIGWGTQLSKSNMSSPPTFTPIAEVNDLGGLEVKLDKVDATHLMSPNRKKEYVAGVGDFGVLSVKCNLTTANAAIVKDWVDSGAASDWQYIFPSPLATYHFSGVPASWATGRVTPSGLLEVTFGIQLTGAIT